MVCPAFPPAFGPVARPRDIDLVPVPAADPQAADLVRPVGAVVDRLAVDRVEQEAHPAEASPASRIRRRLEQRAEVEPLMQRRADPGRPRSASVQQGQQLVADRRFRRVRLVRRSRIARRHLRFRVALLRGGARERVLVSRGADPDDRPDTARRHPGDGLGRLLARLPREGSATATPRSAPRPNKLPSGALNRAGSPSAAPSAGRPPSGGGTRSPQPARFRAAAGTAAGCQAPRRPRPGPHPRARLASAASRAPA